MNTVPRLQWYLEYRGLPPDTVIDSSTTVKAKDLIQELGVPHGQRPKIVEHLAESDIDGLLQVCHPGFNAQLEQHLLAQFPGLEL